MSLILFEYSGIIQVLLPGTGTRACWYLVVLQIFQFELIFILNLDHHFTINLELDTRYLLVLEWVYTMEHGTTGYATSREVLNLVPWVLILNLVVVLNLVGPVVCVHTHMWVYTVDLQGRCARKGHLVTRITVTLSIFIFSTCFLVQNCRESQGASF